MLHDVATIGTMLHGVASIVTMLHDVATIAIMLHGVANQIHWTVFVHRALLSKDNGVPKMVRSK